QGTQQQQGGCRRGEPGDIRTGLHQVIAGACGRGRVIPAVAAVGVGAGPVGAVGAGAGPVGAGVVGASAVGAGVAGASSVGAAAVGAAGTARVVGVGRLVRLIEDCHGPRSDRLVAVGVCHDIRDCGGARRGGVYTADE